MKIKAEYQQWNEAMLGWRYKVDDKKIVKVYLLAGPFGDETREITPYGRDNSK